MNPMPLTVHEQMFADRRASFEAAACRHRFHVSRRTTRGAASTVA
jgi:hypothetical protein